MDAIEKAIRSALDKGDARKAAYRERVYKSAFAALERALNARETITGDVAERRRTSLRNKILEIESEFAPAAGSATGDAQSAEPPSPEFEAGDRLSDAPNRISDDGIDDFEDGRRRPWAIMFMAVLLIAAAGTGAWWTIQSGILIPAEQRDGTVPNPPPKLEGESFKPEKLPEDANSGPKADLPRDWIGVYETANAAGVTVTGGARADIVERDGESYLRVGSSGGTELLFDIGEGTLERIAGGKALFSISARAQEGETTQISVACNLGELGDCGRKRFEVGAALSEFLFEIELVDAAPGSAGTIAVNPDISNTGRKLDIKEIRVAITQ